MVSGKEEAIKDKQKENSELVQECVLFNGLSFWTHQHVLKEHAHSIDLFVGIEQNKLESKLLCLGGGAWTPIFQLPLL